jgi:hypothetical protein
MPNIMYDPKDVGKEILNSRGQKSKVRKYHMTDKEMDLARKKWKKEISGVDSEIVKKANKFFFNPYRRGVYYYQIYSMFLLGANRWHSLGDIIDKMEEIMSNIIINKDGIKMTSWEKFKNKSCREASLRYKDHKGRVQENMIFFQRLNKLHPTGYKLMQVKSAVDMKRTSRSGFPNGCYFYRLSTYSNIEKALPVRDFKNFNLPVHEGKYVNYKFVGTIITRDKVISEGVLDEVSQM